MIRKSDFIAQLQAIPGDPLVFIDIDGVLSDDIRPAIFDTNERTLQNMHSDVKTRPEIGEQIILF